MACLKHVRLNMQKAFEQYQALLPLAIDWLEWVEQQCLQNGRQPSAEEMQDAISVGVSKPEKVRVLTVQSITRPDDPVLLQAAIETGLLGETATARAVGYGIEVVAGSASRRLLRHEFRHVYQFEQAGSLELFVSAYIESVLSTGYHDSVFEQDARAYENPD